jgi:hypothetical protein
MEAREATGRQKWKANVLNLKVKVRIKHKKQK